MMTNTAADAGVRMDMITLPHPRHGQIQVAPDDIIQLLAPLPPFVGLSRYVLVPDPTETPFLWLQAVDEPALCLVVAPYAAVVGQAPEPSAALREQLGLHADEAAEAYVIVSLAEAPDQVTMNLLAPVYVCARTRRGRQVVGEGDVALARVPLF